MLYVVYNIQIQNINRKILPPQYTFTLTVWSIQYTARNVLNEYISIFTYFLFVKWLNVK